MDLTGTETLAGFPLWESANEQNFCFGAGGTFPLYPEHQHLPDTQEHEIDNYNLSELDTFRDFLLPMNVDFGTDDTLFPELYADHTLQPFVEPPISPELSQSTIEFTRSLPVLQVNDLQSTLVDSKPVTKPQVVTIKLKKVKQSNASALPEYSLQDEPLIESEIHREADASQFYSGLSSPESSITLKEAIDLNTADSLLESLFDQESSGCESTDDSSSPSISVVSSPQSFFSDDQLYEEQSIAGPIRSKKSKTRRSVDPLTRYERKKAQNKEAATRYRNKKKEEDHILTDTIKEEEAKQKELQKKYRKMKRELQVIKRLLREAFIVKGVAAADVFKRTAR